jgi:tetratricopeptide (TPR) repeat protein
MAVEARGFFGMTFRDHWIRVPGSPPPAAADERREEYASYLEASYQEALARPGVKPERAARLRMRLGELLFAQKKPDPALRWLREALTFAPLYRDRIVAAEIHERAGKREEALKILTDAVRSAPENNRAYYTLAKIHIAARGFAEAEKVLAAWEKAKPGDPLIEEVRGEMERGRKN